MRKLLPDLRIAFSVFFGIACVLSIALWVRSFSWWDDAIVRISSTEVHPISAEGRIVIFVQKTSIKKMFSHFANPLSMHQSPEGGERHPWFGVYLWQSRTAGQSVAIVKVAHCVLVMVAGALAIIPWCPFKFSLRSLLIATTAAAAVLGVMVWADTLGNHSEKRAHQQQFDTKQ
jgi:hypothetical protein